MNNLVGFSNKKKIILENYFNKNLHNSLIFSGLKGIGKKTFVFDVINEIFSRSVNKNQITHHLNLIKNHTHPNIRYIKKDYDVKLNKEKNIISIEQIRKLKTFINESSFDGFNKFIIIDSSDDLSISASNSLLKILEEPKNNTYIFLISHQFSSLLPTIRSRCLKFKFKNHNFDNFNLILTQKTNEINDEEIKFLFDLSNGSPGLALSLRDEKILELYNEILDTLVDNNPISINNLEFSNKVSHLSNDEFKIFLSILKFILINLNKLNHGINIFDQYLSNKISLLNDYASKISKNFIIKKLEYLINNENDLFIYNLDKKLFVLNFFAEIDN